MCFRHLIVIIKERISSLILFHKCFFGICIPIDSSTCCIFAAFANPSPITDFLLPFFGFASGVALTLFVDDFLLLSLLLGFPPTLCGDPPAIDLLILDSSLLPLSSWPNLDNANRMLSLYFASSASFWRSCSFAHACLACSTFSSKAESDRHSHLCVCTVYKSYRFEGSFYNKPRIRSATSSVIGVSAGRDASLLTILSVMVSESSPLKGYL